MRESSNSHKEVTNMSGGIQRGKNLPPAGRVKDNLMEMWHLIWASIFINIWRFRVTLRKNKEQYEQRSG